MKIAPALSLDSYCDADSEVVTRSAHCTRPRTMTQSESVTVSCTGCVNVPSVSAHTVKLCEVACVSMHQHRKTFTAHDKKSQSENL
ncbi:Hypothetical protein SMAX5B_014801 [Scophthalmus maximus]|uniref:Uncharacterized protein n=1 Tax=Scophthalmus maximus TaxID=52904 RepID=A0A2U9C3G3_SCOMX|nr:Hypothetical protein SMAX5B_014801 [Scophthalmus maximus]